MPGASPLARALDEDEADIEPETREREREGSRKSGGRRTAEGMSYLGLSRSLSDRLLVRLTRQCRGETGNYVWGSISGVVRRVGARLGGILREKTPTTGTASLSSSY